MKEAESKKEVRRDAKRTTKSSRRALNIIDEINDVGSHIDKVLEEKRKEYYFESLAIVYSLIEDVLTWGVFVQILWNKTDHSRGAEEINKIKDYVNSLNFNALLNVGLCIDLLDYRLFKRLEEAKNERNILIHEYWLYIHKGKKHILRKKLEKLSALARDLAIKLEKLIEETGMDESYGLYEIRSGRNLLP